MTKQNFKNKHRFATNDRKVYVGKVGSIGLIQHIFYISGFQSGVQDPLWGLRGTARGSPKLFHKQNPSKIMDFSWIFAHIC